MGQILPGEEGQITVTFDTKGYGGRYMREEVQVETNDAAQPWLSVMVRGQVEIFADIEPVRVMLLGKAGDAIQASVRIQPRAEIPFKITGVRNSQGDKFIRYRLIEGLEAGGYRLEVENGSSQKGVYYDQIVLETDSEVRPELKIPVIGRLS